MTVLNSCCNFGWSYTKSTANLVYNVRHYKQSDGSTVWSLDACGGLTIRDMYAQRLSGPVQVFAVVADVNFTGSASAIALEYYIDLDTLGTSLQWSKTRSQLESDSGFGFAPTRLKVCMDTSGNTYVGCGHAVIKYNSSGVKQWSVAVSAPVNYPAFGRGQCVSLDTDGTYVWTANTASFGEWWTGRRNAGRLNCSDGSSQIPTASIYTTYATNENTDWLRVGYNGTAANASNVIDTTGVRVGSDVYFTGVRQSTNERFWRYDKGGTYWSPPDPRDWTISISTFTPNTMDVDTHVLIGGTPNIWQYRSSVDGSIIYSGTLPVVGEVMQSLALEGDPTLPQFYVVNINGATSWVRCISKDGLNTILWTKKWPEVGPSNRQALKAFKRPSDRGVYVCGQRVGNLVT